LKKTLYRLIKGVMGNRFLDRLARNVLDYTPAFRKKLKDIKDEQVYRERKRHLGRLADNGWVKEIKEELISAAVRATGRAANRDRQ
jgi:hypothetical protein